MKKRMCLSSRAGLQMSIPHIKNNLINLGFQNKNIEDIVFISASVGELVGLIFKLDNNEIKRNIIITGDIVHIMLNHPALNKFQEWTEEDKYDTILLILKV